MDYEKRYKEAIEAMKDCIPDKDGYVCVRPCDIFSELQESKDEKIRKELVEYFRWNAQILNDFDNREVIAWLEKQVKETAISQHENKTCKRNNDSLTSKIINALCTITKYAERELGLDAIDGVDIEDICYWLKKQGQSFPILSNSSKTVKEWTEEDERGSDETIELLEYFINYTPEFRRPAIRRSIDWLQSLKQRMEE